MWAIRTRGREFTGKGEVPLKEYVVIWFLLAVIRCLDKSHFKEKSFSLQSQATVHLCEEVSAAGVLKHLNTQLRARGYEFLAEGMVPPTVGRSSHLM